MRGIPEERKDKNTEREEKRMETKAKAATWIFTAMYIAVALAAVSTVILPLWPFIRELFHGIFITGKGPDVDVTAEGVRIGGMPATELKNLLLFGFIKLGIYAGVLAAINRLKRIVLRAVR